MMETPLEMCDRHLREGLERLARHDAMTAAFVEAGRSDLVANARKFRLRLIEFQASAQDHADRLRKQI